MSVESNSIQKCFPNFITDYLKIFIMSFISWSSKNTKIINTKFKIFKKILFHNHFKTMLLLQQFKEAEGRDQMGSLLKLWATISLIVIKEHTKTPMSQEFICPSFLLSFLPPFLLSHSLSFPSDIYVSFYFFRIYVIICINTCIIHVLDMFQIQCK